MVLPSRSSSRRAPAAEAAPEAGPTPARRSTRAPRLRRRLTPWTPAPKPWTFLATQDVAPPGDAAVNRPGDAPPAQPDVLRDGEAGDLFGALLR